MKFTQQALLFLLPTLLAGTALAQPVDNTEDGDNPDIGDAGDLTANHTATGPSLFNPDPPTPEEKAAAANQKKCFTFTSDNPNWHFAGTGPWASAGHGAFGKGSKKICVPHNDGAGGAMFIGPESNPTAGNTKFECFLPSSGKGNCDMSLVDGYSLSVTCDIQGGHKVGGPKNLFKTGINCPDKSEISRGICKNDNGNAPHTLSDVAKFFKAGTDKSNFYCIWWKCKQDYYFNVGADIKCHVSGGR